jgi:glycosyltransferase involved in cell wall biosynthesis
MAKMLLVMRIAVLDYLITPTNPIGGCHRRLLDGLSKKHQFTVFAVEFDNPDPDCIRFVRVPVPRRPLALLFVSFQLLAPVYYLAYRLRQRARFDLVQVVESNLWFGDLSYAQFCHRAFLRRGGARHGVGTLRGLFRWLDHRLHAVVEPWTYHRVRSVVVPSPGLARELEAEYPQTAGKIAVVPNPIDLDRMRAPQDFDRTAYRASLGLNEEDLAVVFVALGHFERKGLPILLAALDTLGDSGPELIVVGGQPDLVRSYQAQVRDMGLSRRVRFVGQQNDVRPFLWAADIFALPSAYEAFPLVFLEAGAAGLPLLVTPLYGVEDVAENGRNGLVVERTVEAVADGLRQLVALPTNERRAMGEQARVAVRRFGVDRFLAGWSDRYHTLTVAKGGDRG